MNINKVILMGRLTADPELKMSSNNVPVLRFTVAVNRKAVKQNDTADGKPTADFIDCTAFFKTAEFVSKFFKKGSVIIVFGSLQIETWKDKNGNNQRSARIIVDEVQFGESRRSDSAAYSKNDSTSPAVKEPDAYSNALDNDFFADIKDIEDELPF
ncbi:MAG: single-stranded DNA-binding protein [Clostridia bacterium]|nr:single-stranded DNA-binding protein [Clostridia bacterium]